MFRRLWGRLGLRARITGLYAAGGLLLSLAIALSTATAMPALTLASSPSARACLSFLDMMPDAESRQERLT